jgi:hypothetical protein
LLSANAVAADPPGLILTSAEAARQRAQRRATARLANEPASFFFRRAGTGR